LGSIVYFPSAHNGELVLSVDRSALTKQFVEDLFDRPNDRMIATHHLAQRGVRLVLTPKRLKVIVYPSVIVALRADVIGDSAYRSFVDQPVFVVEQITGRAFASVDLERISTAFSDVFVQYLMGSSKSSTTINPDGSAYGFASLSSSLPPRELPSRADH